MTTTVNGKSTEKTLLTDGEEASAEKASQESTSETAVTSETQYDVYGNPIY